MSEISHRILCRHTLNAKTNYLNLSTFIFPTQLHSPQYQKNDELLLMTQECKQAHESFLNKYASISYNTSTRPYVLLRSSLAVPTPKELLSVFNVPAVKLFSMLSLPTATTEKKGRKRFAVTFLMTNYTGFFSSLMPKRKYYVDTDLAVTF